MLEASRVGRTCARGAVEEDAGGDTSAQPRVPAPPHPYILHFEPSLDALSLQSDVVSSSKILSPQDQTPALLPCHARELGMSTFDVYICESP